LVRSDTLIDCFNTFFCAKRHPGSMSRLRATALENGLDGTKSERGADTGHNKGSVAAGEHAFLVGTVDLDTGKARPARDVLHGGGNRLDLSHGGERGGVGYPAAPGDAGHIDRGRGVAGLPAGLAI